MFLKRIYRFIGMKPVSVGIKPVSVRYEAGLSRAQAARLTSSGKVGVDALPSVAPHAAVSGIPPTERCSQNQGLGHGTKLEGITVMESIRGRQCLSA